MAVATIIVASPTPSGTNITGGVPHTGLNFATDVEIFRGGVRLIPGLAAGGVVDVIPGNNPAAGDIKLTSNQPALYTGEILTMKVHTVGTFVFAGAKLESDAFQCLVWAEQSGSRVDNPDSAALDIREGEDTVLWSFPLTTSHNNLGIFKFEKADLALTKGKTYILDIQVTINGTLIKATRGFNLY